MSKTKSANWDYIEGLDTSSYDMQSAQAEMQFMVSKTAEDVATFTKQEIEWFAEALVTYNKDKAADIATMLQFEMQDREYRHITDIKKTTETGGTHLHGHIKRTYAQLVEVFGEPHFVYMPRAGAEDKIDREWAFKFPDGRVFTVYNWKNGKAYCGTDGLDVEDITDWNVGAHQSSAYHDLTTLLDMKLGKEQ